MRFTEAMLTARWADVDWDRQIIDLTDAKAGPRKVPLNEGAMAVLSCMGRGVPEEPIFGISYEALKKIFSRACERAGIEGVGLHDLRHTGATRTAKRLNGNFFLLKAFTGHKTLSQLERYVHIDEEDVVESFKATENLLEPAPLVRALPVTIDGSEASKAGRRAAQMGRFTGQAPSGTVVPLQSEKQIEQGAGNAFALPAAVLFKQAKLPASASMSAWGWPPFAGILAQVAARWAPEHRGCMPLVQLSAAS
jgi:hypothetical protein